MYDCGTTDWTTCTKKDSGPNQNKMGNVFSGFAQESSYSDSTPCENDFMGSSGYTTDMSDTQEQLSEAGVWSTQNLSYQFQTTCTHYKTANNTNSDFQTYDDRN